MRNLKYNNDNLIASIEKIAERITSDKRSNHHRDKFFPTLINELGLKVGVEVGTDKGGFAHHLLSKSNLDVLHCIDPWIDDFGSDYKPGYYDKNGSNRMNDAAKLLNEFVSNGRCILHRNFSADVASEWDEPIDFIYIDGDHSLEGIYTDVYSWINKVKVGGILAGHDYKDGPKSGMKDFFGGQLPYRVKTVVDNFCQQYGFKLHTVGGRIISWWFVKT